MMAYLRKFSFKFYQIIFLILPATLLGEASDYNMPVGVTEVSKEIFDLHMLIFWVCVWIGVVVFGIMFWSLWKYRKSKGAVAADFDDNFWLEIGWTVAATLILVVIAVPSTQVMVKAQLSGMPECKFGVNDKLLTRYDANEKGDPKKDPFMAKSTGSTDDKGI